MKDKKNRNEWIIFLLAVSGLVIFAGLISRFIINESEETKRQIEEESLEMWEKKFEEESFEAYITVAGFKGQYTNVIDELGANANIWFGENKTRELKRGDKLKVTITNDWERVKLEDGTIYESSLNTR